MAYCVIVFASQKYSSCKSKGNTRSACLPREEEVPPVAAEALNRELQEPALPAEPCARIAAFQWQPLQEEPVADQSTVVSGQLLRALEPAHRHAHRAAVLRNPPPPGLRILGVVVCSDTVVATRPWRQLHSRRDLAVVDEGEVLVRGADVDREEGEAGGYVDAACLLVAGEEGGLHGHHQRVAAVENLLDVVQALPERPAEVRAASGGVACQVEGWVASRSRAAARRRARTGT
jgi:hypothetical protein